jgi:PKD domain/NHL repeat
MTSRSILLSAAVLATAAFPAVASADVVKFGSAGTGDGLKPTYASGITSAADGSVFTIDRDHNRVLKFGPALGFEHSWGTSGAGAGEFQYAQGVALDSSGRVLVGDANGYRVQRFTADGAYTDTFNTSQVSDIAAGTGGSFYVASYGRVVKYDANGDQVASWDAPSSTGWQAGIDYDPDSDEVYVVDGGRNLVRVFNGNLVEQRQWGGLGAAAGKFDSPTDVAVADGRVYVSESGSSGSTKRIQRFTSAGVPDGIWSGDGGLDSFQPFNLATDGAGRLYVTIFFGLLRVDPDQPVARLDQPWGPVLTGTPVSFDASRSAVPFGNIAGFAWDLDGNGSFESAGGATISHSFATAGTHNVSVRVSAGNGQSAVASTSIVVNPGGVIIGPNPNPYPNPGPEPDPDSGPVGVSIDSGDVFTNDKRVQLHVSAPRGAGSVTVSNDGGFKNAKRFSPRVERRQGAHGQPRSGAFRTERTLGSSPPRSAEPYATRPGFSTWQSIPTTSGWKSGQSGSRFAVSHWRGRSGLRRSPVSRRSLLAMANTKRRLIARFLSCG